MVESCRVELRAEATGLQPAYPVPGLKLSIGGSVGYLLPHAALSYRVVTLDCVTHMVTPPGLEPGLPA